MPDFGIFRGFNEKLFGDKLYAGQLPTQLGLIGSFTIPKFLLDLYPNAAAAYSLRKLRSAYTGSAIQVRRTNNDVLDIGFTSTGELDTAALLAFTGTGALDNGFVTTWYDQSGNARNATQTTAANQPKIVNAGSVLTQNSKPCFYPDAIPGLDTNFTDTSVGTIVKHLFIVADTTASVGNTINYQSVLFASYGGSGAVGNQMIFSYYTGEPTIKLRNFDGSSFVLNASSISGYKLWQSLRTSSALSIGENDSAYISGGTPNTTFNGSNYRIGGAGGSGANNSPKLIQEVIYYPSDQSANLVGIQTNINDFYSIY
jgi:hypothetical protein